MLISGEKNSGTIDSAAKNPPTANILENPNRIIASEPTTGVRIPKSMIEIVMSAISLLAFFSSIVRVR